MTKIVLDTWHRIEDDGSGDIYLVPADLFETPLDEAVYEDANFEEKFQQCIYIGGFASDIKIRGEVEKE